MRGRGPAAVFLAARRFLQEPAPSPASPWSTMAHSSLPPMRSRVTPSSTSTS